MNLAGKVAVVTGGAVRLGRSIAEALATHGCHVCIQYGTSEADAREVVTGITEGGGVATAVQANLERPLEASRTIVAHATAELGTVEVLVNNAAIFEDASLATTTENIWDRHLAINLKAPFFLTQAFAAQLGPSRRAHVVNIADWRALRPNDKHIAYSIAKAGLVAMTRALAVELAPAVQVNAIAPGAILPPAGADADHLTRLASKIPLRRTGSPADIVAALCYLLESDFVTGEVMHVTGGEQL